MECAKDITFRDACICSASIKFSIAFSRFHTEKEKMHVATIKKLFLSSDCESIIDYAALGEHRRFSVLPFL